MKKRGKKRTEQVPSWSNSSKNHADDEGNPNKNSQQHEQGEGKSNKEWKKTNKRWARGKEDAAEVQNKAEGCIRTKM